MHYQARQLCQHCFAALLKRGRLKKGSKFFPFKTDPFARGVKCEESKQTVTKRRTILQAYRVLLSYKVLFSILSANPVYNVTLSTVGKIFISKRLTKIFFLFFPKKTCFDMRCNLYLREILFWEKIRKIQCIIDLSSAE